MSIENSAENERIEKTEEDRFQDMRSGKIWLELIKEGERYFQSWHDKCDNIDDLYANLNKLSSIGSEREMQIFWANLEVLKPSIYSQAPAPVVTARFKDRKPILRHASEILERSLVSSFDQEDINQVMVGVRDDLAICSRGVAWLRLEDNENVKGETISKVCYEHLSRKDFMHEPARKWKEVGWVARKAYLDRGEMRERFEQTSDMEYSNATYTERKEGDNKYSPDKKAAVWEIWHKKQRVVVWVAEGCENVLDIREPFLELHGFFPCPRPVYGTLQRETLIPVPDFVYYKDQIEEINELTARISALSEKLKVKGFYPGGNEDLSSAIERIMQDPDNRATIIGVSNFAVMGAASLRDSIVWLPVLEVASVITQLIALRKHLIEDVYQITGISDIMRGSTNASETLGAQQLKSQYGSVRIRDRQEGLVRIARDITRISAEIMAENFSIETFMSMSQYNEIPTKAKIMEQVNAISSKIMQARLDPNLAMQAQQNPEAAQQIIAQAQSEIQKLQSQITIEQVIELLRSEKTRPFTLEIETDSTIQPDENAAKQRTTEFLGALSQALGQLVPMVSSQPQSAEFAGEILKFAVSPFRAGRSLEASIETFVDQMKQVANEPKPTPEAEKAKAEAQMQQTELQMKQMDMQVRMQEAQGRASIDMQKAQVDLQKTNAEIQKIMAEIARINAQTGNIDQQLFNPIQQGVQ